MSKTKKIILTALLLALNIVLSRFLSIKTPITKISFAFIPTMLCATWLGFKWTVLLNILGDVIGATLFPTGPYFIGYTISTAIAGFIYGLFLYNKDKEFNQVKFIIRAILAVTIVAVIVNMLLNTIWTSYTAGKAFKALFFTRLPKQLFMIPVHVVLFLFIEKILRKPFYTYIKEQ